MICCCFRLIFFLLLWQHSMGWQLNYGAARWRTVAMAVHLDCRVHNCQTTVPVLQDTHIYTHIHLYTLGYIYLHMTFLQMLLCGQGVNSPHICIPHSASSDVARCHIHNLRHSLATGVHMDDGNV